MLGSLIQIGGEYSGVITTFSADGFQTAVSWETLAARASYNGRALAKSAGVSLRTLQRHFAKHYKFTIGEFLLNLRMKEAIRILAAGQSVKSVCYTLGFKQVSHFSRVFKSFHGTPPGSWLRPLIERISFENSSGEFSQN